MEEDLAGVQAQVVDASDVEARLVAAAARRAVPEVPTTATHAVIAACLATAKAQLAQASARGGARTSTPNRTDALAVKVQLLARLHAATEAPAEGSSGVAAVLDQGDAVRFGAYTPFEVAQQASRAQSSAPAAPEVPAVPPAAAAAVEERRAPVQLRRLAVPAATAAGVPDDYDVEAYRARLAAQPRDGAWETLPGSLRLQQRLHRRLLPYQATGLRWLADLHAQRVGGIIADEMGLGKTVQVACLLGALASSGWRQPALVVCPATMLGHWQRELTGWCPHLRVLVMHDAARSIRAGRVSQAGVLAAAFDAAFTPRVHAVVTTYDAVRRGGAALATRPWGYLVLDEGHRIRNPDAGVTQAVKAFNTVHRIVVTGAPIQNKLAELWSLFDFVFPGRLGSRETFQAQFAKPVAAGSWANASPLAAQTAFQCAVVLRDLIRPYLLRRVKRDVQAQLPPKSEKVVFTRLSPQQLAAYRSFITSPAVARVLQGGARSFRALGLLQTLCNHPGLFSAKQLLDEGASSTDYWAGDDGSGVLPGSQAARFALGREHWAASGKLVAALSIVKAWVAGGHRVLWFTQGREMLDVIEGYVADSPWRYMRMDGTTAIASRQGMVDTFNGDDSIPLFLLTTRVGGLGVNLTGADRVLLFDPAWNPSTDAQARERAWRLGQTKPVVVYRLVSAGTLEEKVYERQVFKQLLMARVLGKASGKAAVSESSLRELFTLVDPGGAVTGPAGMGRLQTLALAGRALSRAASGSTAPGGAAAGVAVRVQAYDSDGSDGGSGSAASASSDTGARGEAAVLSSLMQGSALEASFNTGLSRVRQLSASDRRMVEEAAKAAAAAAAEAAARDGAAAPLPSLPTPPPARQAVRGRRAGPPRQAPPAAPPPAARPPALAALGRMRMVRHRKPVPSVGTGFTPARCSGPGQVRGGFLLGVPPGAVLAAATSRTPTEAVTVDAQRVANGDADVTAAVETVFPAASLLSRLARRQGRFTAAAEAAEPVPPTLPPDASGRSWAGALGARPQAPPTPAPLAPPSGGGVAGVTERLVRIFVREGLREGYEAGVATKRLMTLYGRDARTHKHVFRSVLRSVATLGAEDRQWRLQVAFRPRAARKRART